MPSARALRLALSCLTLLSALLGFAAVSGGLTGAGASAGGVASDLRLVRAAPSLAGAAGFAPAPVRPGPADDQVVPGCDDDSRGACSIEPARSGQAPVGALLQSYGPACDREFTLALLDDGVLVERASRRSVAARAPPRV